MERDNLDKSVGKGRFLHRQAVSTASRRYTSATISSSDSEAEDRFTSYQALLISRLASTSATLSTSSSEDEDEEVFRHHQALLISRITSITPTISSSSSDEWSTTSSGSASVISMPLGCDHQVFQALQTNECQNEYFDAPPASALPQPPAHWLQKNNQRK
ncbi:unnamed protein product [Ceratitis capitata]|uniref:(Mediterranean fruit fly) hypothetical protein n=1 Tax=Ceratitis capitata TaxID=7213 RepID=A0A811V9G8_CERCA|nr:unnamed protein product [Ceratitis capitata]